MKHMILGMLCLVSVNTILGMGAAVQQIYKDRVQNQSSIRQRNDSDEHDIWTGLGIATIQALKSLSWLCHAEPTDKKRHKRSIGTKFE
jgi:hypothetical protein